MSLHSRHKAAPSQGFVSYLTFNERINLRSLLSESTEDDGGIVPCDELLFGEDTDDTSEAEHVEMYIHNLSHIQPVHDEACYEYDDDDNKINYTIPLAYTCESAHHGAEYAHEIYKTFENFYEENCGDHEHTAWGIYLILYTAFVLFLGCLFKWITQRFRIPIPYTVMLLSLGFIFEAWESLEPDSWGELRPGFNSLRKIDPHMILHLFIPGMRCFLCNGDFGSSLNFSMLLCFCFFVFYFPQKV